MKVIYTTIVIFTIALKLSCAYNILVMLPFGSKSHRNGIDPTLEELGLRGHQVTVMSAIETEKNSPGVKNVFLPLAKEAMDAMDISFFQATSGNMFNFMNKMFNLILNVTNATYHEPEVLKLMAMSGGASDYDAMIIDAGFGDSVLPLAHHLKLPVIYASPATLFPNVAWNLNIPYPFSYISFSAFNTSSPMTFLERTGNTVTMLLFTLVYRNYFMFSALDKQIQTNFFPNSPPILQLENRVAFQLTNSHPALNTPGPLMPYYREVGCLHCQKAKPLPKDLEKYLESAKEGVIYFSLGSVTKGSDMPIEMRTKIINVFGKLKQQILWKYEKEIENLPKNVKLTKWAPQQDLLGHPKVRLFISHGGGLSTMETAYHGCPILGFPLAGDQLGNIGNAQRHGFAEGLDWQTFTEEEFLSKINRMLADQSYRESALNMSVKLKDTLVPPRQEAAYWVEYVIRHKGAPYLRSGADHLNFFQYFLLDVIAFLAFVVIFVIVILCLLVKLSCRLVRRLCCREKKQIKLKTK